MVPIGVAALAGLIFHSKKEYYSIYVHCIYIQSNILYMSEQMRMGGWHRMGSDDDFPIRQVLSVGAWCSIAKMCIIADIVYLQLFQHFIAVCICL